MKALRMVGTTVASAVSLALFTAAPVVATGGDALTTSPLAASLSVAVQPSATLGGGASGAASVSGRLGQVTVTDTRAASVNWSAFASSTPFSTGTGNPTSTGVIYSTGLVSTTGVITIAPQSNTALNGTPTKVAGPTVVVGNTTASWDPTLTVALPANAIAGTYTGTITTSVS